MTSTAQQEITVESRGAIRVVTIRNVRYRNAITPPMHRELMRVWRELVVDDQVGAIVLTGEGDAFSAGGDIDGMVLAVNSEQARLHSIDEARQIVKAIVECPVPTIAAVNGPAVGAGATFALLCDVAVMSDDAYFADPHVGVGLVAGDGGAIIWPLLVGLSRTKQLLFTGDRVSAERAVEWGLAMSRHPNTEVLPEALRFAERLLEQPQYALRATKAALNIPLQQAIAAGFEASLASELASQASEDFARNVQSMVEQRAARRREREAAAGTTGA
jgi:enoyl-CoA hydratase